MSTQSRLAATEELREQPSELRVDRLVGGAQQLARLAVDPPNRVLEGRDRLVQVGDLRVEETLALERGVELVERGQVDRAKRRDRVAQPGDLALQPRGFGRVGEGLAQQRLVRASLGQLLGELRRVQLGRLFLELELRELFAQRSVLALDALARLVERAHRMAQFVQALARRAERLLCRDARPQRELERRARRCVGQFGESQFALLAFGQALSFDPAGLVDLRFEAFDPSLDLARRERRFLGEPFGIAQCRAPLAELALGAFLLECEFLRALLALREFRVQALELGALSFDRRARFTQCLRHLVELAADSAANLLGALELLLDALRLEPPGGEFAHCAIVFVASEAERGRCPGRRRFDLRRARPGLLGHLLLCAQLARELFEFVLARQHALLLGVDRVEPDPLPAHHVTLWRDERCARAELLALRHCLFEPVGGEQVVQPVVEQRLHRRVFVPNQAHERAQRVVSRRGRRRHGPRVPRGVERHLGRGCVARERRDVLETPDLARLDAFAQHRLDRGFPAVVDVQASARAGPDDDSPWRSSQGTIRAWLSARSWIWRNATMRASIFARRASASRNSPCAGARCASACFQRVSQSSSSPALECSFASARSALARTDAISSSPGV